MSQRDFSAAYTGTLKVNEEDLAKLVVVDHVLGAEVPVLDT